MYRKNEVQIVRGERDAQGYSIHVEPYQDAREKTNFTGETPPLPRGTAFLPHSCQEWVIGGPDEVRALITDLQEILATQARVGLGESKTSGE